MNQFCKSSFAAAALFLAAISSHADFVLPPNHPDGIHLLSPPPVPGTAEHNADLAECRAAFRNRTDAEFKRAKDESLSLSKFESAIGPSFKKGAYPKMEVFFQCVKTNISDAINIPKDHFKRLRPYQIDPSLAYGKPEGSASYPSGHSVRGTVTAMLLAELFPDKKEAILQIGRDIGWNRVLIGKHFYTDVVAGRVLAQAIVHELHELPDFEKDLAAVKAEIAANRPKESADAKNNGCFAAGNMFFRPPTQKPTSAEYTVIAFVFALLFVVLGIVAIVVALRAPADKHVLAMLLAKRGVICILLGVGIWSLPRLYRRLTD
jgi:acid phosphatase (class A)